VTVRNKKKVKPDARAAPPITRSNKRLTRGGEQAENDNSKRSRKNHKPSNQTEVAPACTSPHIPQPPVANTVSQQQLPTEPVSTANSSQQLAPSGVVVGNNGQGHMMLVPDDTASNVQIVLPQHQQTGDDLPPTLSPAKDNSSPDDETHAKKGNTFFKTCSLMLPYVSIYHDSLM
jgi:hypothetical protein